MNAGVFCCMTSCRLITDFPVLLIDCNKGERVCVCRMLLSGASWYMPPPELTAAAVISRNRVAFPVASPGATTPGGGKMALTSTDVDQSTAVD